MPKAVFPGSFDPPTNGHLNIIQRASRIFDELLVVIAVNAQKKYYFSAEERMDMMLEMVKPYRNIKVFLWDRLIVDFAQQNEARVILRGVRALTDFEYEFELSMVNKGLKPGIETIFMPTDPRYFVLRSSFIKELAGLQGDITDMVPPVVVKAFDRKVRR